MAKQVKLSTERTFVDAFNGKVLIEDKGRELLNHCSYRAVGEDAYGSELYRGLLMDCPGPHLPRPGHKNDISYPATHLAFVELHVSDRDNSSHVSVGVLRLIPNRFVRCTITCLVCDYVVYRNVTIMLLSQVEHRLGKEKPKAQDYLVKLRQVQQRRSAYVSVRATETSDR